MVSIVSKLVVLATFLSLAGCGSKYPPGMPKLYPVKILFVQEGTPLAKANVMIESPDQSLAWSIGGTTDDMGFCEPATHGFPGVPQGKFKVSVRKSSITRSSDSGTASGSPSDMGNSDSMNRSPATMSSSSVVGHVEEKYTRASTTPLEIEVPLKDKEPITLDVGKPVEIKRTVQGL